MEVGVMNLSLRLAGIFGTFVFLLTSLPGFYRQIQPHDFSQMATDSFSGMSMLETIFLSLGGAMAAGFIGYTIGDILSKPNGKRKKTIYVKRPQIKEFVPTYTLSEIEEPLPLSPPPPASPEES
jgi:hypothetical protein